MSDDLSEMIDGVTSSPSGDSDAAASIVDPELLARMRESGKDRGPLRAKRVTPAIPVDEAGEDDEPETSYTAHPARNRPSDYKRYRKDELVDEAERLAQELRDERALRAAESETRKAAGDPDALRDLADTIKLATQFGFGVMAQIRGPHWNATPEQSDKIGNTGAKALAPYASGWDWLPAAQFAIALGGTIAQKVVEDKRINALPVDVGPDAVG